MYLSTNTSTNKHFYLSGLIAFGIYIFCFVLFLLYISEEKAEKFDAISKNTVLELEILIVDKSKIDKRNKSEQKDSKKSQEVVQKSKATTAKTTTSVKSLFANVKVSAPKVIEEEVLNVKKAIVTSRFKAKFEKQRKTNNVRVSKLLDSVKTRAKSISNTDAKNKSDEYFSKIYELLTQRWVPMLIVDKLSAEILIMISPDGSFSYRFRSYSDNDNFNNKLEEFLNEQILLTYPKHNKGRVMQLEVKFTAEGLE